MITGSHAKLTDVTDVVAGSSSENGILSVGPTAGLALTSAPRRAALTSRRLSL